MIQARTLDVKAQRVASCSYGPVTTEVALSMTDKPDHQNIVV